MKRFFLFFTLLALLSGCGKDENEGGGGNTGGGNNPNTPSTQTSITISPSALTFDAQGEAKSVTVTCTTGKTWTLSGGESWCTASGTNGANGATVTFTAEANTSPDERNATYTFTCGDKTAKLVVTQKQQDALTVTSSKVEVDAQGGPINVEVKANIPFEYVIADKDKGWITPVETKAMQTTILTFNVAQNESLQKREGTITIKSGELSETVTVYQAGAQPTIVITQNTYEVSGKGETIKVEINSNVEFSVSIPAVYSAWIQEDAEPRALSTHTKYFTISANPETQSRTGEILFTSQEYNLTEKVTIQQRSPSDPDYTTVHVPTKGTLASVLAENDLEASSIVLLKITGEINDVDMVKMQDMPNLKSLDISGTNLTELPAGTFQELNNLDKVILPNTLTSIGKKAFYRSGLVSIEIPASVKTIGEAAFLHCQLASIEIPASVETIERSAFQDCMSLRTVTFEKGSKLKTIEGGFEDFNPYDDYGAFSGCSALTSIEIPANVETIGAATFHHCWALKTVTFEKGSKLKTIEGSTSASLYYGGAFGNCSALTSIEIPASVETIGQSTFTDCEALTTVTFEKGSKLKTIGKRAFNDLPNLKTVDMSACTQVETFGMWAFVNCKALQLFKIGTVLPPAGDGFTGIPAFCILKVPAESVEAYKKAYGWHFSNISALDY